MVACPSCRCPGLPEDTDFSRYGRIRCSQQPVCDRPASTTRWGVGGQLWKEELAVALLRGDLQAPVSSAHLEVRNWEGENMAVPTLFILNTFLEL